MTASAQISPELDADLRKTLFEANKLQQHLGRVIIAFSEIGALNPRATMPLGNSLSSAATQIAHEMEVEDGGRSNILKDHSDLSVISRNRSAKGAVQSKQQYLKDKLGDDNGGVLLEALSKLGDHTVILVEKLNEANLVSQYEKAVPSFGVATPIAISIFRKQGYIPNLTEENDVNKGF